MCCSVAPARFSRTTLYAAEVKVGEKVRHVMGYQNKAQDLSLKTMARPGGNAMILHLPAVPGTMTQANVIPTADCPNILQDMARAIMPPPTRGEMHSLSRTFGSARVEVFASGIYTVVLADDPRAIPGALDQVPEEKRPPLNTELFETYAKWFPDWPIALCCFNNQDAKLATPMLWWYEPQHPNFLFAPALDAHTGAIPDLSEMVWVDHTLVVSSYRMYQGLGKTVGYTDPKTSLPRRYILDRVTGRVFDGQMPNGDFVIPLHNVVEHGVCTPVRQLPPGA